MLYQQLVSGTVASSTLEMMAIIRGLWDTIDEVGAGWIHHRQTRRFGWNFCTTLTWWTGTIVKAPDSRYCYSEGGGGVREGWFWKHLANRSAFWLIAERHATDQVTNWEHTTTKAEERTRRRSTHTCIHFLQSLMWCAGHLWKDSTNYPVFSLWWNQAFRRGSRCSSSANSCRAPRAKRSLSWRASSQPKRAMAASV